MKKLLSLVLVLVLSLSVISGCAKKDGTTVKGKIALVTDVGTIDDESFNQATWQGVKEYGDAHGVEYKYYQPIADSNEERLNSIEQAVADGATVIVLPGFLFGPVVSEAQSKYPDVKFIAVDVSEGDLTAPIASNAYTCTFSEEQAGYLAGYAAVKDGYTELGFLGGMSVPAVIRYGFGYLQGIDAAAKELGVNVNVKYTYGGQFYGDANITSKMDGWYAAGTQVVFACGGGIYTSALDAAVNYNGMIIGVDVDQHSVAADKNLSYDPVLTSAMKGLSATVVDKLGYAFSGKWDTIGGKVENLSLAEGDYLGLPTAESSWVFKTFTVEEYNKVLADLKSGKIVVDNNTETAPALSNTTVEFID